MIEIKNLTKKYGKKTALENISLKIPSSNIIAVAGPNGSGKTTLIKSILGLVKFSSGSISIDGTDISVDISYRNKIGYMPQIARYPENLTVNEIISLICRIRQQFDKDLLKNLIAKFKLEPYLDFQLKNLSGGTRQKVSGVLSFMVNPEILILDEPATGLDPVSSTILKEYIRDYKKAGKTVIIISHIMSEISEIADEIVYILDGEIIINKQIREFITENNSQNLESAISFALSKN